MRIRERVSYAPATSWSLLIVTLYVFLAQGSVEAQRVPAACLPWVGSNVNVFRAFTPPSTVLGGGRRVYGGVFMVAGSKGGKTKQDLPPPDDKKSETAAQPQKAGAETGGGAQKLVVSVFDASGKFKVVEETRLVASDKVEMHPLALAMCPFSPEHAALLREGVLVEAPIVGMASGSGDKYIAFHNQERVKQKQRDGEPVLMKLLEISDDDYLAQRRAVVDSNLAQKHHSEATRIRIRLEDKALQKAARSARDAKSLYGQIGAEVKRAQRFGLVFDAAYFEEMLEDGPKGKSVTEPAFLANVSPSQFYVGAKVIRKAARGSSIAKLYADEDAITASLAIQAIELPEDVQKKALAEINQKAKRPSPDSDLSTLVKATLARRREAKTILLREIKAQNSKSQPKDLDPLKTAPKSARNLGGSFLVVRSAISSLTAADLDAVDDDGKEALGRLRAELLHSLEQLNLPKVAYVPPVTGDESADDESDVDESGDEGDADESDEEPSEHEGS